MLRGLQQRRTVVNLSRLGMLPLLGLCLASFGLRCDARAVNVSNTWTMPQEGLNVFYRFFRDRISWFEADAVCQFHHANLVTVDNSFQFDATSDLLRELDVNDIVWIGLMRPQNSDRFMWSNSRPLVVDTGYWAESLPLMDAPLCAVIDPIRDYRWHALRCGGPETASFLCEMPVPSWADACILKEMPNLTMQYMADTASIELIRNCQEEGLLRHTCKGKEDRERAIRKLICPKERLEAQRINDITNSHFKSLQIINNIRTDNNENNDIELLPLVPNYGASSLKIEVAPSVPAPIERINLDRLMMADAPVPLAHYQIPDEVPMPVKKAAKKVTINDQYAKKSQQQEPRKVVTAKPLFHLDIMMGDQPALSDEQLPEDVSESDASNEIFELLPHKKKFLPLDLRTMSSITEATATSAAAIALTTAAPIVTSTTTAAAPATATATPTPAARTTAVPTPKPTSAATSTTATPTPAATTTTLAPTRASTTTTTTTAATTSTTTPTPTTTAISRSSEAPATITIRATAPLTTATTKATTEINMIETTATTTTKGTTTTTAKELVEETDRKVAAATGPSPTTTAMPMGTSTVSIAHPMHPAQQMRDETPHPHVKETADNSHFIPPMLLVKSHYVPPAKHSEHVEHIAHGEHEEYAAHGEHKAEHVTHSPITAATATTATAPTTPTTPVPLSEESSMSSRISVAAAVAVSVTAVTQTQPTSTKITEATVAVKTTPAKIAPTAMSATTLVTTASNSTAASGTTKQIALAEATTTTRVLTTDAPHLATTTAAQPTANENSSNAAIATAAISATAGQKKTDTKMQLDDGESGAEDEDEMESGTSASTRRNFLQEETEAPFKPNRRRSLTKPETVSYFKKILG